MKKQLIALGFQQETDITLIYKCNNDFMMIIDTDDDIIMDAQYRPSGLQGMHRNINLASWQLNVDTIINIICANDPDADIRDSVNLNKCSPSFHNRKLQQA